MQRKASGRKLSERADAETESAYAEPPPPAVATLLALQRSAGNRAVAGVVGSPRLLRKVTGTAETGYATDLDPATRFDTREEALEHERELQLAQPDPADDVDAEDPYEAYEEEAEGLREAAHQTPGKRHRRGRKKPASPLIVPSNEEPFVEVRREGARLTVHLFIKSGRWSDLMIHMSLQRHYVQEIATAEAKPKNSLIKGSVSQKEIEADLVDLARFYHDEALRRASRPLASIGPGRRTSTSPNCRARPRRWTRRATTCARAIRRSGSPRARRGRPSSR